MKRFSCVLTLTSTLLAVPVFAQSTIFGSIYNFDAYNDTGQDAHGFQAPILDVNWFRRAKIVLPEPKQAVSARLDRGVLEWFKRQGKGYQTRINAVPRAFVESQR